MCRAVNAHESEKFLLAMDFLFPSLSEGLGEGAKRAADKPSPNPLPKGEGEKMEVSPTSQYVDDFLVSSQIVDLIANLRFAI